MKRYLLHNDVFPGCGPDCCDCPKYKNGCDNLKAGNQVLINEGSLQFDRQPKFRKVTDKDVAVISITYDPISIPTTPTVAPLAITVPGPVSYVSDKVVPWHYGADVYCHGVKQEESSSEERSDESKIASAENFSSIGQMTRSGRVFGPRNVQDIADALAKAKGKQVMVEEPVQGSVPKPAVTAEASPSTEEVEELLRIIRKSD